MKAVTCRLTWLTSRKGVRRTLRVATPHKRETRREKGCLTLRLSPGSVTRSPSLVCPPVGFSFLGSSRFLFRPLATTGAIQRTGFQEVPPYTKSVQTVGTSEVVASYAARLTSVSVLTEPAVPRRVTAAEGHAYSAAVLFLCVPLLWQCPAACSAFLPRHAHLLLHPVASCPFVWSCLRSGYAVLFGRGSDALDISR